jgi:hypothetical protein
MFEHEHAHGRRQLTIDPLRRNRADERHILQPRAWAISPIACQNGSSSFMRVLCPDSFTDRWRFVETTV